MKEKLKEKIVTFGEVLMRLSPEGFNRFGQGDKYDMHFGGAEVNVCAALTNWGWHGVHATSLPANAIGFSAESALQSKGIDTSEAVFDSNRIGIYFLETGIGSRASRIVYDRDNSAFSQLNPDMFDWNKILKGADWFHWTGITPALSYNCFLALQQAIETANKMNIPVSGDIFYRSNLWQYGHDVTGLMSELVEGCDVIVADENINAKLFGIETEKKGTDAFIESSKQLMQKFPRVKKIANTLRISHSASCNQLKGIMWNGTELIETDFFEISQIVDRIGSGDAFMAGLIHGLKYYAEIKALHTGVASAVLKHSISGDINLATWGEVETVAAGIVSGLLKR